MSSFNRVLMIGNLTRDPQLKNLPTGTVVAEFGLASNRKWKDAQGQAKEEVTFVDCSAFGKTAEVINQWCKKGKALFIEGRLKFDSWDDRNGGGKRSKITVVVENFQFLGSAEGAGGAGDSQQGQQQPQRAPGRQPVGAGAGRAESPFGQPAPTLEEADIPF